MSTATAAQSELVRAPAARASRTGPRRVGLLGAGYIADYHIRAVRAIADARLVAICDRAVARARDYARRYAIPGVHDSLESMLRDEQLDVVHILLPPDRHFDAAMAVLEAGKHVLLEKPMCISVRECAALVARGCQSGLGVGVAHNFLFGSAYQRLREDIRQGLLGPLDHVTVTWNKELPQVSCGPFDIWMLQQPRNIVLEIGPHLAAHLLDLVGQPEELRARASNPVQLPTGRRFYRRWQAQAYCGKTAVELDMSMAPGFTEHTVHVRGFLGSATVDFERNTYVLRRHTPHDMDFDRWAMTRQEARSLRRQGWRNIRNYVLSKFKLSREGNAYESSIRGAAEAFYRSLEGHGDQRVTGEWGRDVIALCERIAEQAAPEDSPPAWSDLPAGEAVRPRVLVLGATGFIGRELVRQLVRQGHAVRVLVRSASKLPPDLLGSRIEVMQGDLNNVADIDRALEGIQCVYHLARAMVKSWEDYQRYEIEVTRQIAQRCLARGIGRFIYTGTIDSYYAGASAGVITEDTPLDPMVERRNYYARAKAASEQLLLAMHREQKLPLVIFRPGIVIGRGGSPFHWGVGMWRGSGICQIWGRGTNKLPLVLVEDVASALVAGMTAEGIEGESFNLIGDPCLSAQEYLDELERAGRMKLQRLATPIHRFYLTDMLKWVVKMMVRHHDRRRPSYRDWESRTQQALFDCSKAKSRLGWRPASDRAELVRRGIQLPLDEVLC